VVEVSQAPVWSRWAPFSPQVRIDPAILSEVLDGGQAFRWTRQPDGAWLGLWGRHAARLRPGPRDILEWSRPLASEPDTGEALARYLDAGRDPAGLADLLPWRSDAHLAQCIRALPGLRILRQPFGETLLCFLCSSAKRIAQIRQMAALMAGRHGSPLPFNTAGGTPGGGPAGEPLRCLPTWGELSAATEGGLRACRLGFRARYVHQTAAFLATRPGWLEETEELPYPEAKARLCGLPGVGEKIADCVLLYGGGRLEAFPVDVWILKSMARRYGLAGWPPRQVAHFGRTHFGPLAGLAQQYLFAWERRAG
jgi:N-glycosylase/DNA lyase